MKPRAAIAVLHEDAHLLAIDKPVGLPSAPLRDREGETAVDFAWAHAPAIREVDPRSPESGLLHRLDTGTSGVLLFAKDRPTFERLRTLWKTDSVSKIYRAIGMQTERAEKIAPPFEITTPIGHSAKSTRRMIALSHPGKSAQIRGKAQEAVTEILAIEGPFPRETLTLADFELRIRTGVRHQIRVHLASIGWPILGDPIYGRPGAHAHPPEDERMWLHAWKLRLLREDGTPLEIESKLPPRWR